jgi:hypothetical protein
MRASTSYERQTFLLIGDDERVGASLCTSLRLNFLPSNRDHLSLLAK